MGEADRRGTFGERKKEAIRKAGLKKVNQQAIAKQLEEKKEAGLSLEEKSIRSRDRIAMLSFMATANRLGYSPKEMKRRVMRFKKKGN